MEYHIAQPPEKDIFSLKMSKGVIPKITVHYIIYHIAIIDMISEILIL